MGLVPTSLMRYILRLFFKKKIGQDTAERLRNVAHNVVRDNIVLDVDPHEKWRCEVHPRSGAIER
jgi:hypothetical protein